MKIAIDIRPTNIKGNGIAVFTENIYKRLKEKSTQRYTFLNQKTSASKAIRKITYTLWEHIMLPLLLVKNRADIFYSTKDLNLPVIKVCKYVSTIHDLIPLILQQQYYPNKLKWYLLYKFRLWLTVKYSDIIITVSEYTKKDIMEHLNVPAHKIKVIHEAIDEKFKLVSKEEVAKVKEKLNVKSKYILGIGGAEYRKNVKSLISAFNTLKEKDKSFDYQLVVIGKAPSSSEKLDNSVIYTGFVSDEELVALYNGAEVFVYPSLYEGFGLPPLEAMACGTPVITSNSTSIPEVVGDAAILIDPENIEEMAKSLKELCEDNKLRNEYIQKGFNRIKDFSWDKTAESISAILDGVN